MTIHRCVLILWMQKYSNWTTPGLPEAIWVKLCGQGWLVQHGLVTLLGFGGCDIAGGAHQAAVIEPVDPFQRRELDGFKAPPRPAPMDDLGVLKLVDGLGPRALS